MAYSARIVFLRKIQDLSTKKQRSNSAYTGKSHFQRKQRKVLSHLSSWEFDFITPDDTLPRAVGLQPVCVWLISVISEDEMQE
jgi:hypothetical protein